MISSVNVDDAIRDNRDCPIDVPRVGGDDGDQQDGLQTRDQPTGPHCQVGREEGVQQHRHDHGGGRRQPGLAVCAAPQVVARTGRRGVAQPTAVVLGSLRHRQSLHRGRGRRRQPAPHEGPVPHSARACCTSPATVGGLTHLHAAGDPITVTTEPASGRSGTPQHPSGSSPHPTGCSPAALGDALSRCPTRPTRVSCAPRRGRINIFCPQRSQRDHVLPPAQTLDDGAVVPKLSTWGQLCMGGRRGNCPHSIPPPINRQVWAGTAPAPTLTQASLGSGPTPAGTPSQPPVGPGRPTPASLSVVTARTQVSPQHRPHDDRPAR